MARESTALIEEHVLVFTEAHKEIIHTKFDNYVNRTVDVTVGYYNSDYKLIATKAFFINGQLYDKLMSESPDFAPGKPLNEYREQDLWFIIDQLS